MRLILLSPMRTQLNIELPFALSNEAVQVLQSVAQSAGAANGISIRCSKIGVKTDHQKFSTLSGDDTPGFLQPLFTAEVATTVLAARAEIAAQLGAAPSLRLAEPARVYVYDNTLAMVELALECNAQSLPEDYGAEAFERRLSEIAHSVALETQKFVLAPLIAATQVSLRRAAVRRIPDFANARDESLLFDDVRVGHASWPATINPVLWTARLVCIDQRELANSAALRRAVRYDELQHTGEDIVAGVRAHVGTTFLTDRSVEADFRIAHRHAQFVYCQYDLLVDAQQRQEARLFRPANAKAIQRLSRAIDQANGMLAAVRAEHRASLVRLQGTRLAIFKGMHSAFSTSELAAVAQERATALEKRLTLALQTQRVAQDSVAQAILYLLGGTQVVALGVDLFDYANSQGRSVDERGPGLLTVLDGLSFNTAMNVTAIAITLGLILVLFWRRRA